MVSCRKLFPLLIKHKRDYCIFCEIHASLPKHDLLAMKNAGVTELQIGIEALDSKLLDKMNKGTRFIDNLETMKYCEELGLNNNSNLMIGFPNESQADIDRSVDAVDYACSYSPCKRFVEYELREGSPIHRNPSKYGIISINESALFGEYLKKECPGINLWFKNYKTKTKKRNYSKLHKRIDRWISDYNDSSISGTPLLYYVDMGDYIMIFDKRTKHFSISLDNWKRDVYLFCDSIRNKNTIISHFSSVDRKSLESLLRKLFDLKIMYCEDNCYLSLAIHAEPHKRRFMPFI